MKLLLENFRKYLSEIRFRAKNPSELGVITDVLIERYYSGEMGLDELFQELKLYFASVAMENKMDIDALIDHLIERRYSEELSGLLYDPKYREMLK